MSSLNETQAQPRNFVNGLDGNTGLLLPLDPRVDAGAQALKGQEYRRLAHWAENRDQFRLPAETKAARLLT